MLSVPAPTVSGLLRGARILALDRLRGPGTADGEGVRVTGFLRLLAPWRLGASSPAWRKKAAPIRRIDGQEVARSAVNPVRVDHENREMLQGLKEILGLEA